MHKKSLYSNCEGKVPSSTSSAYHFLDIPLTGCIALAVATKSLEQIS